MQFGISKCGVLEMKIGQVLELEGIKLPNWEKKWKMKKRHEYLYVLQFDLVKSKEIKDMITKE